MSDTPPNLPSRIALPYVPGDAGRSSPPIAQSQLEDSRARAIRLLTDRYADDSLTEDEFEWRLSHLAAANTPASLDALVADLTSPSVQFAAYPAAALTSDYGKLTSIMSHEHRTGQWAVPRLFEVRAVMAEVKLVVGIPNDATLAEGGIKASLDVVDARFPTKLQIAVNTSPARIDLFFKSDVSTTFMRGNLTGWYKITDLCAWGYCLLEDGLGIDTSGEVILWSDPGFAYNANLVDLSGQVAVQSSTTSLGVAR